MSGPRPPGLATLLPQALRASPRMPAPLGIQVQPHALLVFLQIGAGQANWAPDLFS